MTLQNCPKSCHSFLKHEELEKVVANLPKRADFPYGIDFNNSAVVKVR